MYPRYYLVEVVLLLVLSHGGWNGPSVSLLSCTSDSSKVVREVLNKRFWPLVSRHGCSVSEECPLHPRRDVFGWLRTELLLHEEEGALRCPLCGRTIPRHDDFASHLDAQHATVDAVCLDSYCDVFRCEVLQQQKEVDVKAIAARRECDPAALAQVQAKCRSLMRQCTIGMLANLSSQDFQEIEEDLDHSICSFLTCERYWDDFDSQVRPVPVLILAFFGLLVIAGFSFCYYGTWLLLERQPSNQLMCCKCQKAERRRPERRRPRPTRFITSEYGGDVSRLIDDVGRASAPDYSGGVIALPYPTRQNSPEYSSSRQNSPDYTDRRRNNTPSGYLSKQDSKEGQEYPKSLEYPDGRSTEYPTKRQNSSEYPPRKPRSNSPDYIEKECDEYPNRHSSLEYPIRQNSHEYPISRQNSPEYPRRRRHNSPDFLDPQSCNEYPNRHSSMERASRQHSSEYPNRHSSMDHPSRQNSPEYPTSRQKYPEKRPNSEYVSKQNSSNRHDTLEYPSRQNSPEYTYPIRRRPHSLDYPSRQNSPEFPNPPKRKFLSKQHSLDIQDPPSYPNNDEYSRKRAEFSAREENLRNIPVDSPLRSIDQQKYTVKGVSS